MNSSWNHPKLSCTPLWWYEVQSATNQEEIQTQHRCIRRSVRSQVWINVKAAPGTGLGAVYNMHHPHEGRKTQQHCIHSQDLVTAEGRERWRNISVQKQITSDCYCERKAADSEQARWTQMWSLYGNNGQCVPAFSDHRMLLSSCGQILKNMVRRSTVWMASNQGMNQTRPGGRREDPIFISCASLPGNTQMWKLEKTKRKTLRQRAVQIKIV